MAFNPIAVLDQVTEGVQALHPDGVQGQGRLTATATGRSTGSQELPRE